MIYYLLNVALILAGCLVFYKLLLQKETFFPLNRFILLSCLVLAFSLPFVPVPQKWSFRKTEVSAPVFVNQPVQEVNNTKQQNIAKANNATDNSQVEKESIFKEVSVLKILIWAYWLGVIVFGINFLFQLFVLLYRSYSKPVIKDGRFRIVELSGDQAPCSFGNNIFINPEKYDWDTYNQIILHEKIHIQQGHSYDIFIAELALVFQWFNPFAWLYRKAMEDNLEFLTDYELLQHSDVERSSYQMSLVKVSAPHFPVSLTTNYNQSILKKRLIMMNAKKSNVNSTWKYLFILPLLLLFVSLFNEPVVYGKANTLTKSSNIVKEMPTEGSWFATIKDETINIRFMADEDGKRNNSSSTFLLSDFKSLPTNGSGAFSLTRDAGTMNFTGKFDGNTGMGKYKFDADASFNDFLVKEGVTGSKEKADMALFLVNVKKDYVKALKNLGYNQISKGNLIPLAALNVSADYIKSIKAAGLDPVSLEDLIPLKALDVDAKFIAGIKESGYKKITADKMVAFKAQGIDGAYLKSVKIANEESLAANNTTTVPVRKTKSADKAVEKHDDDDKDSDEDKAFGNLIAKKVLNVTPEFAKGFTSKGLTFTDNELIGMKSIGVTPEFFEGFKEAGLTNLTAHDLMSLKSVGSTANDLVEFKKLGFKDISIHDLLSAKTTGTSPVYVASMKKNGHNYSSIKNYIKMKVVAID